MPLQLPLCGLPSEARCLPGRCRPATHCLKANRGLVNRDFSLTKALVHLSKGEFDRDDRAGSMPECGNAGSARIATG
jgi:hypothetical protein